MSYNDTDEQVKYAIENGTAKLSSDIHRLDKDLYDIKQDTDLLTQIGVCVGVAAVALTIMGLFCMILMFKIALG